MPVGVSIDLGNGQPITVEPATDHTEGIGVKAFMTQIIDSPETAPGLADVDSGRVTLTSPQFDLSEYVDPSISFALWYSNDALPIFPDDDKLYVRLSNDGGLSWADVLTLDHGLTDWEQQTLRVRDFMPPTGSMMFRVVASDSGEQGWTEAGLDDFAVTDNVPSGVSNLEGTTAFAQLRVAPNPFRNAATFALTMAVPQRRVRLELFDVPGRRLATLHNGAADAGTTYIKFSPADLPEGNYLWRLTLDDGSIQAGVVQVLR